jgi:hypothetical protein
MTDRLLWIEQDLDKETKKHGEASTKAVTKPDLGPLLQ